MNSTLLCKNLQTVHNPGQGDRFFQLYEFIDRPENHKTYHRIFELMKIERKKYLYCVCFHCNIILPVFKSQFTNHYQSQSGSILFDMISSQEAFFYFFKQNRQYLRICQFFGICIKQSNLPHLTVRYP